MTAAQDAPWTLTATDLADYLARGVLHATAALESCLLRIAATNPRFGAEIHLDEAGARASPTATRNPQPAASPDTQRPRGWLQHYPLILNQCERISCCRIKGF